MTGRINLSHPRRKRLQEWLDGGLDDRVTQHVAHCERCARTLEELAGSTDEDELVPDAELVEAIRDALAPPDDINERVLRRVAERERASREVALLLDIFGISKDAADLMMSDEIPERTDRRPANDHEPREDDE